MGRTKLYKSNADRVSAYRETVRRLDVAVTEDLNATIERLSSQFGVSKSDVVNSLIREALTNRDQFRGGLYRWKK